MTWKATYFVQVIPLSTKAYLDKWFLLFTWGPNHTVSLDGHDKLCGFQKSTFPLHIYGAQDCFSGEILFLKNWTSNNNPDIIGYHYFDYLSNSQGINQ